MTSGNKKSKNQVYDSALMGQPRLKAKPQTNKSDVERFIEKFKQLIEETNMDSFTANKFGLVSFKFKDGTYIGVQNLMNRCTDGCWK